MKNSGICPKCGSGDLVRFDGYCGAYGAGNNLMTGTTVFSAVDVNRYVCLGCGFTEEWIDRDKLDKLRKSRKAKPVR